MGLRRVEVAVQLLLAVEGVSRDRVLAADLLGRELALGLAEDGDDLGFVMGLSRHESVLGKRRLSL